MVGLPAAGDPRDHRAAAPGVGGRLVVHQPGDRVQERIAVHLQGALALGPHARCLPRHLRRRVRPRHRQHPRGGDHHRDRLHRGGHHRRIRLRPLRFPVQGTALVTDPDQPDGALRSHRDPLLHHDQQPRLDQHLASDHHPGPRQRHRDLPVPPILLRNPAGFPRCRPDRWRNVVPGDDQHRDSAEHPGHHHLGGAGVPLAVERLLLADARGPRSQLPDGPGRCLDHRHQPANHELGPDLRLIHDCGPGAAAPRVAAAEATTSAASWDRG